MFTQILNFLKKKPVSPDSPRAEKIIKKYIEAGGDFGGAVSDLGAMGQCIGFEKLLARWEAAEKDYASLGYRTISIDAFTDYGGWGKSIDKLLRVSRGKKEQVIYHAEMYKLFWGNYQGGMAVQEAIKTGKPVFGTWIPPSTENEKMVEKWRQSRQHN